MPRKTHVTIPMWTASKSASMRPRPDAAENVVQARRHLGGGGAASMRPRPDAAENYGTPGTGDRGPRLLQ